MRTAIPALCILAGLAMPISSALTASSAAASSPLSTGVPFDYTAETINKGDDWENLPVVYEDWARNADMAVTLDQHLYAVMLPLVQKYASVNRLDIAVREGTCGISAGMISKKSVDMAGFCCPAGRSDRLPGLAFHTLGIGPIAIIVHKDNPLEDVTAEQARKIFSGEIHNWAELGGPDEDIVPVARLHCKARPGHWRLILDNEELFAYDLQEVGTIPDMVRSVAADRYSVGHLATWNIHKHADQWQVKALKINGIRPDDIKALEAGKYPFYRSYNITTWTPAGVSNPNSSGLVRYLLDNAGDLDPRFSMVPASRLRKTGWKFIGDEMTGEPD